MYFTSEMRDPMETAEQSACLRFAKDFLPEVDKALAQVCDKLQPNGEKADAAKTAGESTAVTPGESTDATKTEPAADDKGAAPTTDGAATGSPAGSENKSTVTIDTAEKAVTPPTDKGTYDVPAGPAQADAPKADK
jgi:hypothetical protein